MLILFKHLKFPLFHANHSNSPDQDDGAPLIKIDYVLITKSVVPTQVL